MKANSDKSKQSNKATRRVLAGVLCGASVLSLVLSLVMPPISQAIANDAQTVSAEETVMGGGSSSESTGVDNTANGDAENQNSDDAENGASEDAVTEGQPSDDTEAEGDARPADDSANGEGAIALAAENEPTHEISSGTDLNLKLLNKNLRDGNGAATFKLTADIEYDDEIRLEGANTKITLDLNGFKIKHDSGASPLFDVADYATLTVMDSGKVPENVADGQQLQDKDEHLTPDNYGKTAIMSYDVNGVPEDLTYYVTESTASGVGTTEKIKEYKATIKGAIVGVTKNSKMKLINVYQHGTFNLESGAITQKEGCGVGNLIYAENGSTVNMSGGYVCGASGSGDGAGIMVSNEQGGASTLNLTGGVIAGNSAYSGGGVYARYSKVTITNGIISGNSTLNAGLGGGIMAEGGIVAVSGGYITNNRMAKFCKTEGSGCHGGAGLAAHKGAHVTISDGQITGNYSEEAGGGVYVTDQGRSGSRKDMAWLNITGGIIASNVSYRSEGAGIRVGQMVDAMIGDTPDNNDTPGSKVYITNNRCMSRFDWGGGGVFVQGDSNTASNAGRLFVYNSYISSNTAGGYGGGVAVCPTGKTLVTNTKGTAIFGNSSARDETDWQNDYNTEYNSGNNNTPHLSGGGIGDTNKTEDREAYASPTFRESGHADFFLAARDHTTPVAVVSGKMLGNIDAKYSGSIELTNRITIPANGAVGVKNSIGLTSDVKATDQAVTDAVQGKVQGTKVTTFITGNYSWDHGGGIMSNGNLYLGVPADAYVYPSLKLKATKELDGRDLKDGEFTFTVYRKDSDTAKAPSWDNNGNFSKGGCELVQSAPNNAGNIAFDLSNDLSKQLGDFSKKPLSDTGKITYSYYLVEDAGNIPGVDYDHAVYEINVTVEYNKTVLMSVPIKNDSNKTKDLSVYNFTIDSVDVTKNLGDSADPLGPVSPTDDYYLIVDSGGGNTFTNKYDPEVSWTPMATKVVEGGEMKAFTLQLAEDSEFKNIIGTAVTSAGKNAKQTLSFKDTTDNNKTVELKYSLFDIRNNPDDSGGSTGGPFKTFTYYVREETDGSQFSHYTYDHSVYEFTVEPTYDTKTGEINCKVTYKKGTVDSEGNWTADPNAEERTFIDTSAPTSAPTSIPTFTNTYSTSLPLSGMSGVTLTYLAGAAVLCAAAAWMHIRRKANAKGGERRE
ncbi:MAG: Spy0128 family protein [Collinsella sp.]